MEDTAVAADAAGVADDFLLLPLVDDDDADLDAWRLARNAWLTLSRTSLMSSTSIQPPPVGDCFRNRPEESLMIVMTDSDSCVLP